MTPFLYVLFGAALLLLLLLVGLLHSSPDRRGKGGGLEDQARSNIEYCPQIQQALSSADREFLVARAGSKRAREVVRQRRRATLDFLSALDDEFSQLLRLARVIAKLSPEVAPLQEFERVRLGMVFHFHLQAIRLRLALSAAGGTHLSAVSDIVSRLNVRMATAMNELGERAALASELASAVDRSDAHFT